MEELLGNGEFGIIVDNDDDALLDGLKRLLSDATLIQSYRMKSQIRGKDFSLERQIRRIEGFLYQDKALMHEEEIIVCD